MLLYLFQLWTHEGCWQHVDTHYRTTCTDTTSAPTKRSVKHFASHNWLPSHIAFFLSFGSVLTFELVTSYCTHSSQPNCRALVCIMHYMCIMLPFLRFSTLVCHLKACMHGVCGWWLWMTVEAYNQLVVWVQHILLLHLMPAVEVNSGQRSCMGLPVVHDVTVKLNNLSPHPTTPLMHAPLHVMLAAAAVYLTAQQHRSRHHICMYCKWQPLV